MTEIIRSSGDVFKDLGVERPARDIRVPFMLSYDELVAIDDWRYANRVTTRSEAIRQLIKVGLGYSEKGKSNA